MTDGEFYEVVIHTDRDAVPQLRDTTAGQALLKMAGLGDNGVGTDVVIRFTRGLGLEMVTPIGVYTFVLNADGDQLVVERVM